MRLTSSVKKSKAGKGGAVCWEMMVGLVVTNQVSEGDSEYGLDGGDGDAVEISEGRAFQPAGTASAKALRLMCT